jgi:TDG/mug DNA glycosylase family protein
VPDLIGPHPLLLIVGINPGLWTAATQTHFCHPSNRFYPALRAAGLIDWELDTRIGMTDSQRDDLVSKGMGITNLVERATARAAELEASELIGGAGRLAGVVARLAPTVTAVVGVTAYRVAFGRPLAQLGRQTEDLAESQLWVLPNPSGLNAHVTTAGLADWMGRVATAAGIGRES